MTWLGIALAVLAAGGFAAAAVLQHAAVTVRGTRLRSLRRDGWWLAGLGCLVAASAVHAVALAIAPLAVVQPIGVLAVLGSTAHAVRAAGRAPRPAEVVAVACTVAGVAGFVLLAAPAAATAPADPLAGWQAGALVTAVASLLVLVGLATGGLGRCLGFTAAGAACYALVSVLTRVVAVSLRLGELSAAAVPLVAGAVLAALAGGWLIQHAYAGGPPELVLATQTVGDPLVAVAVGAGVLGEPASLSPTSVAFAALAAAGIALLAGDRAHNATAKPTPEPRRPVPQTEPKQGGTMHHSSVSQLRERDGLRVLIGADTFAPDVNGAARFAERLATGLAGLGHDVHVVCPSPDGPERTEPFGGATLHRVRSRRTPVHPDFRVSMPWQARSRVREVLDRVRPDVVHAQAHFLVGRALVGEAARRGIPIVATNHFMPENLLGYVHLPRAVHAGASRLAWRDLCRVYGRASAVTAPTPRAVQLLRDNGFRKPASAVSCGIDSARYRGNGETVPGTVLFVGRLDEEKRVDELLGAAARLGRRLPLRVEIVGDGSQRERLRRQATRLGIGERVRFHGFVPDRELLAAYARAEVFCMPGVAELQSLATLEAMSAGKPVVAADAVALPHLVRDGHNGWLFTPGDVDGLADRLRRVLGEPGAAARMGAASRQLVAAHDMSASLDAFERLYVQHAGRPARELAAA